MHPADIHHVLHARRSTRAYTDAPLPTDLVFEVLQAAASAPSNANTQPWRVHVLTGAPVQTLGAALKAAFTRGEHPASVHFPDPLPQEFGALQADFAERYYGALDIARGDSTARAAQTLKNFSFFGAPIGLIFTIDGRLNRHSWLDLGLFVQSVMLAAKARGIDTCPQVSFARFHDVIASELRLPDAEVTVCGMSMGYGDATAAVNQIAMPRRRVEEFARVVGA